MKDICCTVFREHQELGCLLDERDARDLRLVRFDLHDDLRGTVIDPVHKVAYLPQLLRIDDGNFLVQLLQDGRVAEITWVYPAAGGPANDLGTVAILAPGAGLPVGTVVPLAWRVCGPNDKVDLTGACLDIDWDYFAGFAHSSRERQELCEKFFASTHGRPDEIFISYSPAYVRSTVVEFTKFSERLQSHFAPLTISGQREISDSSNKIYAQWRHNLKMAIVRMVKR